MQNLFLYNKHLDILRPFIDAVQNYRQFLGVFPKLRKATNSFVMSVGPSVRIKQLGSHWTDFHEIWHLSIFRKTVEESQILLMVDKNNGYFA